MPMRLLLDESVPWAFRHYMVGHEARTARYVGWDAARATAELLALARDEYDVLVTVDQSIPYQQNITEEDVAVVVLEAGTNDIEDLRPLVPELLNRIPLLKRGEVVRIEAE